MSYKIGDVVPWSNVPNGALVQVQFSAGLRRFPTQIAVNGDYIMCVGGHGQVVGSDDGDGPLWTARDLDDAWTWRTGDGEATIVALGLTGQESADDLRRLAEVFEVREALGTMRAADHATERALEDAIKGAAAGPTMSDLFAAMTTVAERLHAAGWRPGMTAEDAARLLAGDV